MINAIVYIPDTVIAAVQQALTDNTLPTQQAAIIQTRIAWGREYNAGRAYSFMVDNIGQINIMLDLYPSTSLIGAWSFDTGEQVMPFDQQIYLDCMPDNLTMDESGNITHTARPTSPAQVNIWSGQAERDLT